MHPYPIAETFISIQGEGFWAGQRMAFIRFAGCTVGQAIPIDEREERNLPVYIERCHTVDGRSFLCDTNFRANERLFPEAIVKRAEGEHHVCLTGGEPLMHNLDQLLKTWPQPRPQFHIETSGTVPLPEYLWGLDNLWIAVSPKKGARPEVISAANEIKLLVDDKFTFDGIDPRVLSAIAGHPQVWLQPINNEHEINVENVNRCLVLQKTYHKWRLSIQLHKVIGVR